MAVVYFHVKATKHLTTSMEGKNKGSTRWRWKHLQELVISAKKSMFRGQQDQERLPLFFVILSKFPFLSEEEKFTCLSTKFKDFPFSVLCQIQEMPSNVTHHDDRSLHNWLLFHFFFHLFMTPGRHLLHLQLMLFCWGLKSLPTILSSRRLKSPCWVEPMAASSLTKVISRTGRVDDQARAHLAVSRGRLRRQERGGWWAELLFALDPPSHRSDWDDCALLSVRSHWSDLMTHDPNRKKLFKQPLSL